MRRPAGLHPASAADKVFFARYRGADGKDHRHRLVLMSPSFTADEARRAAMIILATREAQPGAHEPPPGPWTRPAAPAPAPPSTPIAARHGARTAAPASSLRNYILPTFGDRHLDEITTSEIQRFHNTLKNKSCAANNARCVLSVMFISDDLRGAREHWRLPLTRVGRAACSGSRGSTGWAM